MLSWVPLRLRAPGSGTEAQLEDDWSSSSIRHGEAATLSSSLYKHPTAQADLRGPAPPHRAQANKTHPTSPAWLYYRGLFNATAHVNKILLHWILIKGMIVSGHYLKGKCFNWFWCLFMWKFFFPEAIYPGEIAFPRCLSCKGPAAVGRGASLRGYRVKHTHELKSRSCLRSRSVISSNMSHKMRCRFPFSFELQVFSNPEALFKDWPLTWPVIPIARSWWPLGINGQHEGHFLEKLWLSMCQFQWSIITKQAKSLSRSTRHRLALRLPLSLSSAIL